MSKKSRERMEITEAEAMAVALAKAIAKVLYGRRLDIAHNAVGAVHCLIGRSIAELAAEGTPPCEVCLGELFAED